MVAVLSILCSLYKQAIKVSTRTPEARGARSQSLYSLVKFISVALTVGLGFFQIRVHMVIPLLRLLPTDVYFENCITKPYHVGHPSFYCSTVVTTSQF